MKLYENGAYLIKGKDIVLQSPDAAQEVAAKTGKSITAEEARENKNPAEPCGLRYEKREWCIFLRIFQNVNLNGQALLFACPYHTIIIACHLRHDIPYIP